MTTLAIQTQGTPAHLRSRAFLKIPFLNQNFTYLAFWGHWFRQSRDLFPDTLCPVFFYSTYTVVRCSGVLRKKKENFVAKPGMVYLAIQKPS